MNTFHYPGQEHQQNSTPPAVTAPAAPAKPSPSAADQQRRVIALQIAQKQAPGVKVERLIELAADIERWIRTGAKPGDVTAHGSTAKTA